MQTVMLSIVVLLFLCISSLLFPKMFFLFLTIMQALGGGILLYIETLEHEPVVAFCALPMIAFSVLLSAKITNEMPWIE